MPVLNPQKRIVPPGFAGLLPGDVYCDGGVGLAQHTVDLERAFQSDFSAILGSGEVWIDPANGSDSNSGERRAPLKTQRAAWLKPNVGLAWMLPGLYTDRLNCRYSDIGANKAIMYKAWGSGATVLSPGEQPSSFSWVTTTFPAYVATTGASVLYDAVFVDDASMRVFLTPRTSQADVLNNVEGWYQNPTTRVVTMRYWNENINAIKAQFTFIPQQVLHTILGAHVYIEGVKFSRFGGIWAEYENANRASLYVRNSSFAYGNTHNLFSWGALTKYQNVDSSQSLGGDGFNYNISQVNSLPADAIEVDCKACGNGIKKSLISVVGPSRNKNGSSAHPETTVVRINGKYQDNFGPNIADTGDHKTWMVGTDCRFPRQEAGDTPYLAALFEGTAYLDTISAGGPTASVGVTAAAGSTVYGNNIIADGLTSATSGTITPYTVD